jgi:hypothetical protein
VEKIQETDMAATVNAWGPVLGPVAGPVAGSVINQISHWILRGYISGESMQPPRVLRESYIYICTYNEQLMAI